MMIGGARPVTKVRVARTGSYRRKVIVEVERARPEPPLLSDRGAAASAGTRTSRRVRGLFAGLAAAGVLLSTGCDSVSGIPRDDDGGSPASETVDAPTSTNLTATAVRPAAPELPPVPEDAPPVGAVPGVPEATPALQRFAVDLRTGDPAILEQRCWTIPPLTVQAMYADPDAVLRALEQPGTSVDGYARWTDGVTTVTARQDRLSSGYTCGRVSTAPEEPTYDAADARHTVRRYLARTVGEPLHPDDAASEYPLTCAQTPATWDPEATGAPVSPPVADGSGMVAGTFLAGITGFADADITSRELSPGYLAVDVPVTEAAGVTGNRTFVLTEGDDGYCIGDISR